MISFELLVPLREKRWTARTGTRWLLFPTVDARKPEVRVSDFPIAPFRERRLHSEPRRSQ
jgi:hypothetical protein